jgi:hypothetical protein
LFLTAALDRILAPLPKGEGFRVARTKFQTGENSFAIGEVANHLADWKRQFPNDRWHG